MPPAFGKHLQGWGALECAMLAQSLHWTLEGKHAPHSCVATGKYTTELNTGFCKFFQDDEAGFTGLPFFPQRFESLSCHSEPFTRLIGQSISPVASVSLATVQLLHVTRFSLPGSSDQHGLLQAGASGCVHRTSRSGPQANQANSA